MSAVCGQKTPVARSRHFCWWCDGAIEKGTKYAQWTWIDDGPPEVVRVHLECKAAWDDAAAGPDRDFYEDGISPGEHSRGCGCERDNCHCGRNQGKNENREIGENTLKAG
jgi:hypothetical protein